VGLWQHASGVGEEVVVHVGSAAEVTVHCHGGGAASNSILAAAAHRGWEIISWQRYLEQMEADLIRAEAAQRLPHAMTEWTALLLLDQYLGCLSHKIGELIDKLTDELTGDITDELTDELTDGPGQIDSLPAWPGDAAFSRRAPWIWLRSELQKLDRTAPFGAHVTVPWRVVVGGRTNVGKSSLINRIVGFERTIVFDEPGTTRDVVQCRTAVAGWPIEMADTAGWRDDAQAVEKLGIARAQAAWNAADLRILVADLSDTALAGPGLPPAPAPPVGWVAAEIVVWNKSDLLSPLPMEASRVSTAPSMPAIRSFPQKAGESLRESLSSGGAKVRMTSAKTGAGCEGLLSDIAEHLLEHAPDRHTPMLFNDRQQQLVRSALEAVRNRDLPLVRQALERLLRRG
jgi:tRNA modification GTPase